MICEKISSGLGTRCYYEENYKVCNEGWQKIELDQEINTQVPGNQSVLKPAEGIKWLCSPIECVRIE